MRLQVLFFEGSRRVGVKNERGLLCAGASFSKLSASTSGQFLVVNNTVERLAIARFTRSAHNNLVSLQCKANPPPYTLQFSPDMTTGSLTDIDSVTSNGSFTSFTETEPARLSLARGFYRITIPAVP